MNQRIIYQCPACKSNGTMFIDNSGRLCCSWIKCPNPCLLTDLIEAKSSEAIKKAGEALKSFVGGGPCCKEHEYKWPVCLEKKAKEALESLRKEGLI